MGVGAQVLTSGILLGGMYALLAVGLTLIFGVLRVVNFAHGEFMMLGMFGAFWMWSLWDIDPYLSVWLIVPVVFGLGALIGRTVIQRTIGGPDVTVVFATLGLSILLQNVALTLWSSEPRSASSALQAEVLQLGNVRISLSMLVSFAAALALAAILSLMLNKTAFGKSIQAVAQQRQAAALMGINVKKVYTLTFAIAVAMAGAMGALIAPMFSVYPRVGLSYIVTAFVIVVLGGLGSIAGAVIASLLIGIVQSVAGYLIGPAWAEMAYFILFMLVLLVRPQGLFGRRGAEVYQGG